MNLWFLGKKNLNKILLSLKFSPQNARFQGGHQANTRVSVGEWRGMMRVSVDVNVFHQVNHNFFVVGVFVLERVAL